MGRIVGLTFPEEPAEAEKLPELPKGKKGGKKPQSAPQDREEEASESGAENEAQEEG